MTAQARDVLNLEDVEHMRRWATNQIRSSERAQSYLRDLLSDLDAVERIMQAVGAHSDLPQVYSTMEFSVRNPFKPGTVKAYIWEALDLSSQVWLSTKQIHALVSELSGEDVAITTISPVLSELRGSWIIRKGTLVALIDRI